MLLVTNQADDVNFQGCLRYAIAHAVSGDTISISPALVSPIVLTQGELFLGQDVTISASADAPTTISGNNASRLFEVGSFSHVTLSNLNLIQGQSDYGGAILNQGSLVLDGDTIAHNVARAGGGIYNAYGTLTITNSTFTANIATNSLGEVSGGAITNILGSFSIRNSQFAYNSAYLGGAILTDSACGDVQNSSFESNFGDRGAGVENYGTMTVTGSVFTMNAATYSGGGLENNGTLTVANSVFSQNSANTGGGLISGSLSGSSVTISHTLFLNNTASQGAGIVGSGPMTLQYCEVRGNRSVGAGGGIFFFADPSEPLEIIGTVFQGNSAGTSGGAIFSGGSVTITGCTISGNSALYEGGGMYLSSGDMNVNESVTITGCTISGNSALYEGGGMYISSGTMNVNESVVVANSAPLSADVFLASGGTLINNNSIIGSPSLVITTADSGPGSLRDAIAAAPLGGTVQFVSGLSGTITLTSGALTITKDITIAGPGSNVITVSGNHASQVFKIAPTVTVTISGLTIADGSSTGSPGGGIDNEGTLLVSNSTISGNFASPRGGGIYNSSTGTLQLSNSIDTGNSTTNAGGGIFNEGAVTVSNCTLSGNGSTDADGGAIFNLGSLTIATSTFSGNGGSGAYGGAVRNDGVLSVEQSTFSGNRADIGGAIYNVGTLIINHSTLSGNMAVADGGGIESTGTLIARNTIFAGNTVNTGLGPDLDGVLMSMGHNLIGNTRNSRSAAPSPSKCSSRVWIPRRWWPASKPSARRWR
jgi:predicted outer membrane repeat protein